MRRSFIVRPTRSLVRSEMISSCMWGRAWKGRAADTDVRGEGAPARSRSCTAEQMSGGILCEDRRPHHVHNRRLHGAQVCANVVSSRSSYERKVAEGNTDAALLLKAETWRKRGCYGKIAMLAFIHATQGGPAGGCDAKRAAMAAGGSIAMTAASADAGADCRRLGSGAS